VAAPAMGFKPPVFVQIQTGNINISESITDIVKLPTVNLGFRPQRDRQKCSQAIASTTGNRK